MDYIQGFVHDSFKETKFYQLSMDFTMVVCNNIRHDDIDQQSYGLDVSENDIICTKVFKTKQESSAYVYLEGYYSNGIYNPVNQETVMSREFIFVNSYGNNKLFVDLTKVINRDKKINLILE